MISDDERRDVARRLREMEPFQFDDGEFIDCGEVEDALGLVSDDGAWYEAEDVMRLADLIEPSIPSDPGEAGLASVDGFIREMRHSTKEEQNEYSAMLEKMSVELHPVDRDALLKLADEIDANGDRLLADSSLLVGAIGLMRCYANSIREALGETRKE